MTVTENWVVLSSTQFTTGVEQSKMQSTESHVILVASNWVIILVNASLVI
jgi:hypothetical protein